MAYDKDKMFQQSKKAIVENKLYYVEETFAFLPISKGTFYLYFPAGSDELNELKEQSGPTTSKKMFS
jgi:hypothetical protein